MANHGRRAVLVTRGTDGAGLAAARQLAAEGWTVFLGRDGETPGRRAPVGWPAAGVVPVPLDVTSEESVAAALRLVSELTDRLDLLVNVASAPEPGTSAAEALGEPGSAYDANVFGPVRVTEAFLPLLRAAERPRVLMLDGTGRASTGRTGPDYPVSAAALTIITAVYAETLPDVEFGFVGPDDLAGHPFSTDGLALTPAGPCHRR